MDHDEYLVFISALRSQESCRHVAFEAAQAAPGLGLWGARRHDRLSEHDGYLLRLVCRADLVVHDRLAPREVTRGLAYLRSPDPYCIT